MEELDELYTRLRERPIVLNVQSDRYGSATGTLFISPNNDDIQFNFFQNKDYSLSATSFTGSSPYGNFKIVLGGEHSSSTVQEDNYNEQRKCLYDYMLFSKNEGVVELDTFNKVTFHYYSFITDIEIDEDDFKVNLFDRYKDSKKVGKDFRIDMALTSHQVHRAFPYSTETKFDRVRVTLTFKKPKRVDEIRNLQYKLDNYLTLFLGLPMSAQEVVLYTEPANDSPIPRYCYLLPHNTYSKAPHPISEEKALSFSKQGKVFLGRITRAIDNQDDFEIPVNLMHVYWEYKERKVYLDSQWSVLLACLEAVFELIHTPSANQQKRESDYNDFIKQLEDLTVNPKLKEWLKDASETYSERKPYGEKAKSVISYMGATLADDKAKTLNNLRNDLMHGRLPKWMDYLSSDFEIRNNLEGPKVNQAWVAWAISEAILKIIKESR